MLPKRLTFLAVSMLLGTAAFAASPAAFVEKGLGGLTLNQKWDERAKQLALKDVVCQKGEVPDLADTFCFFRFATPVEIAGMSASQAGAVLLGGKVVSVTLEVPLESEAPAAKTEAVIKAVEAQWGTPAKISSKEAAFISTSVKTAIQDPDAFLAAPAVIVKADAPKNKLTVTLAGMELAHLLAEAAR